MAERPRGRSDDPYRSYQASVGFGGYLTAVGYAATID